MDWSVFIQTLLLETVKSVAPIIAIIIAFFALSQSRRKEHKDAADAIFEEWWDIETRKLRKYLFLTFIPDYRQRALDEEKSLKNLGDILPEKDKDKPIRLCYFFDKIGWLAASGLVNADYLLGPMQHTLRRTWFTMEPFIKQERAKMSPGTLDPVYQYGFEWLFKRSDCPRKHQAFLVRKRFKYPSLRTKKEIKRLKIVIDEDEKNYKNATIDV